MRSFASSHPHPQTNARFAGEIILDAASPAVPPDFIFPPGEEDCISVENVRSLARWDSNSEGGLAEVTLELFDMYKEFQHKLVRESTVERIRLDYESTIGIEGIEWLVRGASTADAAVDCMLRIDIEPATLVALKARSPSSKPTVEEPDYPRLSVSFSRAHADKNPAVRLRIPPAIDDLFSGWQSGRLSVTPVHAWPAETRRPLACVPSRGRSVEDVLSAWRVSSVPVATLERGVPS